MTTREEIINLSNTFVTPEDSEKLKQYFAGVNDRIDQQKHTIVFSIPSHTGTAAFRVVEPIYAMYRNTEEFNIIYADGKLSPLLLNIADLIVMHRAGDLHDIFHGIINHLPSDKIAPYIIHNVDDNEMQLPKTHPMYQIWIASKRDKQSLRSVRESNGVEITTRKMKQIMSNHNKNVFITRNYFNWRLPQWNLTKKEPLTNFFEIENPERFDFPVEWKDKCVVGWSGLTSHFEDMKKFKPFMKKLHDTYPDTVFIIAGMALKDSAYRIDIDPKTGEETFTEEPIDKKYGYRVKVEELFNDFDKDRIKIYDAVTLESYGWFNSLFDISLALIEHNTFNASKSEIKLVEALYYNSPCVTSYYAGYSDLFDNLSSQKSLNQDLINRMKCSTECQMSEWYSKLSWFVEHYKDEDVINGMNNIQKFIKDFYDIDLHINEKIEIYRGFIEKNIEEQQFQIMRLENEFAVV